MIDHHFMENSLRFKVYNIKFKIYLPAEFPCLLAIVQCDNPAKDISYSSKSFTCLSSKKSFEMFYLSQQQNICNVLLVMVAKNEHITEANSFKAKVLPVTVAKVLHVTVAKVLHV